jgi:D-tyrosyl-tRNA(Tyr) deacylase
MIAVIQRVSRASVVVEDKTVGAIQHGLLVLAGFAQDDSDYDGSVMAEKIAGLRIFSDSAGKMNLCVTEIGGQVLAVSQFTLLGSLKKGRRPSFQDAAPGDRAATMMSDFVNQLRKLGLTVETGQFQAHMEVTLTNDGPVTIILDSRTWRKGVNPSSHAASDPEPRASE